MIKYHENKPLKQNILLLYSSKTEKDIIFKKELDSVKGKWFKKAYVLSREDKKGFETGRIDKTKLQKYIKDFNNKKFYICGPKSMNHDISKELGEFGVRKHDIVFEDFFGDSKLI